MMRLLLTPAERAALGRAIALLDVKVSQVFWAIVSGVAAVGAGVGLTATSAWLIARASQQPPVLFLQVGAVGVRAFGISKAVFRYLERLASHSVALRGMASMRETVYRTMASGRTDAVAHIRRGDLLARTGADIDSIGDVIVRALLPITVGVIVATGTVVLVWSILPSAAIVLALCLFLAGGVGPLLAARAARHADQTLITERAELSALTVALTDGVAELRVAGRVEEVMGQIDAVQHRIARAKDGAARWASVAAGLDLAAMAVSVLAAGAFGIAATATGDVSQVALAVIVLTPLAAFEATAPMAPAMVQLVQSATAAVRVMELLDSSSNEDPAADGVGSDVAAGQPSGRTELRARDVAVGWPEGPVVAHGINLDLAAGQSLAIVGPSGVGKSTLAVTLAGLLPVRDGAVTLDGRPVISLEDTERRAAVVFSAEDAHIFSTTVYENLRVANRELTKDQAATLMEAAGLGRWLALAEDGLDTHIAHDAASISGGERRRLLLARAMATAAPVIIIDEPAEHLDPETADALMADLLAATHSDDQPRTVVVLTHRVAALGGADEVVVLGRDDNSRPATIRSRGTHLELVERDRDYRWTLERERGDMMMKKGGR